MRKNILILGHNDATQFIDIFNQYTRLFDPKHHEVTVVYLTGKPNEATRERTLAENVVFLQIPKINVRGMKIGAIRTVLNLCREKKVEMVICHRYKPTYIMLWVAQFYKFPALISVMHELNTLRSPARQLLINLLQRDNMIFAGVSNAVRDDMRLSLPRIPPERIITLYNMIDTDLTLPQYLSREEARKELGLSESTFVFGHIARLVKNKDQHTLIHAFKLFKADHPNAKLVIIGDGEEEARLRHEVHVLGFEQDILFKGYIVGAHRYMKAFDCFVLSSTQEAFGRVLLEAMLAKCPVIGTRANGIPEVIGDAGLVVNPKQPKEIANAMQQIYSLKPIMREGVGERAYQHVQDHFSIPVFHDQFWQLPIAKPLKESTCA